MCRYWNQWCSLVCVVKLLLCKLVCSGSAVFRKMYVLAGMLSAYRLGSSVYDTAALSSTFPQSVLSMFSDLISYTKSCYIKSWIIRCSRLACRLRPYAVTWLQREGGGEQEKKPQRPVTQPHPPSQMNAINKKGRVLLFFFFQLSCNCLQFESSLKDIQEEDFRQA